MRVGKQKSRTFRRVKKRTPGGKTIISYRLRKPKKTRCADCGVTLKGVARARPVKIKNMPKTKKRPQRPYGGVLCSKCSRQRIIDLIRVEK